MCGMYGDGDEWKLLPRCIPYVGRERGRGYGENGKQRAINVILRTHIHTYIRLFMYV